MQSSLKSVCSCLLNIEHWHWFCTRSKAEQDCSEFCSAVELPCDHCRVSRSFDRNQPLLLESLKFNKTFS